MIVAQTVGKVREGVRLVVTDILLVGLREILIEIVGVTLTVVVAQTVGKVLEGVKLCVKDTVLVRETVCVLLLVRVSDNVPLTEMVLLLLTHPDHVGRADGGIVGAVV